MPKVIEAHGTTLAGQTSKTFEDKSPPPHMKSMTL